MISKAPVELTDIDLPGGNAAVYAVHSPAFGAVFMQVRRDDDAQNPRAVVIADAQRLVQAWRAAAGAWGQGHANRWLDQARHLLGQGPALGRDRWLAYLSAAAWARDSRSLASGRAFGAGPVQPVPAATMGLAHGGGLHVISGVGQILWLLAGGARAFPIECHAAHARHVAAAVGIPNSYAVSVESITRCGQVMAIQAR